METIKSLVYDYLKVDPSLEEKDLLTIVSFRLEDDYGEKLEDFLKANEIDNIKDLKEIVYNCRRAYIGTIEKTS